MTSNAYAGPASGTVVAPPGFGKRSPNGLVSCYQRRNSNEQKLLERSAPLFINRVDVCAQTPCARFQLIFERKFAAHFLTHDL